MRRPCLDCRQVFEVTARKQSRCPSCRRGFERGKAPRDAEPWRRLYKVGKWYRARARMLRRDGHRCRAAIDGVRCSASADLQVHHEPPLEQLWHEAAGDWLVFVELATRESRLFSLCPVHHARADAIRREQQDHPSE